MTTHSSSPDVAVLDRLIQDRHTRKLLADTPLDITTDRATIDAIVSAAGWAPFHLVSAPAYRESSPMPSLFPWRFYVADVDAARAIRDRLLEQEDKSTFPRLLAACDAFVIVTWIPDPLKDGDAAPASPAVFNGTRENMEHIAASGAAVQNMLLAATARGVHSFWATGGPLRSRELLTSLGVPSHEIMLGALFLSSGDATMTGTGEPTGAEAKRGGLREKRGAMSEWARWVSVDAQG